VLGSDPLVVAPEGVSVTVVEGASVVAEAGAAKVVVVVVEEEEEEGADSPAKTMVAWAVSPVWSPKFRLQVTPWDC
jgi:hypothetical protein